MEKTETHPLLTSTESLSETSSEVAAVLHTPSPPLTWTGAATTIQHGHRFDEQKTSHSIHATHHFTQPSYHTTQPKHARYEDVDERMAKFYHQSTDSHWLKKSIKLLLYFFLLSLFSYMIYISQLFKEEQCDVPLSQYLLIHGMVMLSCTLLISLKMIICHTCGPQVHLIIHDIFIFFRAFSIVTWIGFLIWGSVITFQIQSFGMSCVSTLYSFCWWYLIISWSIFSLCILLFVTSCIVGCCYVLQ